MAELKPPLAQALREIERYIDRHGFPPGIRDLCVACDVSSTSVMDYRLRQLEAAGRITRTAGKARSIVVMPEDDEVVEGGTGVPG